MADIAISLVVSAVANRLAKVLIEESAVLGGVARQVEWIERELRSMEGFLEHVERRGYGEQGRELKAWAKKLKDIARDAEDVIETFVIKSVKRRRRGVLNWYDKYKVAKELEQIRRRMRDISQSETRTDVSVTVETPGEASSSTTTTVVAPATATEKLDQILSQNLITRDEVIEIVEEVKDELGDLQNIASNLKSTGRRENVWLEEVKDVCNHTEAVTGNFIVSKERRSKMGRLDLFAGYASEKEFEKEMKYIRTQIGDALHRRLTYGVGGKDMHMRGKQTTPRSTPVPNLSLGLLIIAELPFFTYYIALPFLPGSAGSLVAFVLFILISDAFAFVVKGGTTEPGPASNQKDKRNGRKGRATLRLLRSLLFYAFIDLMIIILSGFLSPEVALLFKLTSLIYEVTVWTVNLLRSKDKNLKCTRRDLVLLRAFFKDTESVEGLNERQRVWVRQLRLVDQNGQSLIAAGYGHGHGCLTLGRRMKFAKDINGLLKEILKISARKTVYGIADIQGRQELVSLGPSMQEGEIIPEHDDNSGGTEERPTAPAASSYRPITGLKEKVQSVRGEMELMDALFQDVQDMGELDGRSRIWVEQMRGIARETESVINDYVTELEHKPILIDILKLWARRVISKKIDEIRNKIEDASRRRKTYGLVQIQSRAVSSSTAVQILRPRTEPCLIAKESSIVGLDDDMQVLRAQLLSSDEKRRCIACIVGIGGTGKTTLARFIFYDSAVADHFECRVWVSLPSNCTPQQLLEQIAKEAAQQIMGDSSTDEVLEALARRKYLLVVDGIEMNSQVLVDTLNNAIPDMSTACRLLLTTRNVKVAQHADTIHPLQLLDDESSWVLFTTSLKVDKDIIPPEVMKVGRKIVMKCGGLPSEIVETSCLLSHKDVTHKEWSTVLEQLDRDQRPWLETLDTVNTDLPLYLRRCLFYFGLFPAEFGIPVRRLVVLWVAESLVHHGEDKEPPEQVAEMYLTELIDRNMVQIAKKKRNGKVKRCRLPNALRQLWLRKDNESATNLGAEAEPKKKSIIRRVADRLDEKDPWHKDIHGDTDTTSASASLGDYRDVLSFLSFDPQEGTLPGKQIGNFLKRCISSHCFSLLLVLDLERVYKPRLPENIARLSRLRYLGLRWTYSESLPSSISSLLKLQTLDLKHTYIHTAPFGRCI